MPYVGIGAQKHQAAQSLCGAPMLKVYGSMFLGVVLTFAIAILGKYHSMHPSVQPRQETVDDVHTQISKVLLTNIDAEHIKQYLRVFTKDPHTAGTENNKKVAHEIADLWNHIGLEDVHFVPYEVLLSYPVWDKPNKVFILQRDSGIVFESKGMSPVIIPDEQSGKNAGIQWVAWASPGKVEGEVVFCNTGSESDLENLKKMGVDVKGKIAIIRYGEGFRGDKVKMAQDFGAIGVILYSDPDDVARSGVEKGNVYPNTVWMPEEGVQRGSIMHGDGDPLTPLYPSKKSLYKYRTIEQAKEDRILPSIPVLPVSYSTAYELLSRMKGRPVPLSWQGGVNVTYRVGPGMNNGETVMIDVRAEYKSKKIRNVVGYIRGHDEPDRYVMLGNHFDAWVYGSMDPNSGTAVLSEVARAMVKTINETGWKPARTLVFCAWDAEEYGLIGSTEFVEDFTELLNKRAVVYLNMDTIQGNTSLHVATTPSVYNVALSASKAVQNPVKRERERGRQSLFDTWVRTFPHETEKNMPRMPVPSGGSDHAPFLNFIGIPVIDFSFWNATRRDTYPLYHTLYETPFLNEHLLDTDNFSVHVAVGQYWAEVARQFVDEAVLPFNVTWTASALINTYIPDVKEALAPLYYFKEAISDAKRQLSHMARAAEEFYDIAKQFEKTIEFTRAAFEQNPYDTKHLNAVNERIIGVERCFINPRGMPGAPSSRHVLFSVSGKDSYSSRVMAGVFDAIETFQDAKSASERIAAGRELAQQISIVQYSVHCATDMLKESI